jgi:hypothetical protein
MEIAASSVRIFGRAPSRCSAIERWFCSSAVQGCEIKIAALVFRIEQHKEFPSCARSGLHRSSSFRRCPAASLTARVAKL